MSDTTPIKTFGPYSPVRRVGDIYFTAGHIGVDPATGEASTDVAMQTRQTLENLAATLQSVGLTLDHVVRTTVFLVDMSDFTVVNDTYLQYFKELRPARSTVAVHELPRVAKEGVPLKVEIEAVAGKGATDGS